METESVLESKCHFKSFRLVIYQALITTLQLILTGGVGGVFIVTYATRDLFLREVEPPLERPNFASDYQELMWLVEKRGQGLTTQEVRRFYQLRKEWSKMHAWNVA